MDSTLARELKASMTRRGMVPPAKPYQKTPRRKPAAEDGEGAPAGGGRRLAGPIRYIEPIKERKTHCHECSRPIRTRTPDHVVAYCRDHRPPRTRKAAA
jgi:hypothetical protein